MGKFRITGKFNKFIKVICIEHSKGIKVFHFTCCGNVGVSSFGALMMALSKLFHSASSPPLELLFITGIILFDRVSVLWKHKFEQVIEIIDYRFLIYSK